MTSEEATIKSRSKSVEKFFKDPYKLILAGIIIFTIIIKLYFYFNTINQPLWYDEADYMSTAKSWVLGIPFEYNTHRPPLFQAVASIGFMFGFADYVIKFLLVLLPSIILVYLVYLLGKEMYNEKIGLIAAFLTSVSWTLLFWSVRYQPDYISMCFQVLAILFMWKYWKNPSSKFVILSGVFAALSVQFKISGLLVPMGFIVFIIIKDRFSAFLNKHYYYFSAAFLLTLLPYLIWAYIKLGNALALTGGYSDNLGASVPFGWMNFNFYYLLTENVLFILFLLGLIVSLKFLFYLDIMAKDKNKCFDPNLFSILMLAVISAFYIFYIRLTDDRWVFLWLPFIFMIIGNALILIYDVFKKYNKTIAALIVIGLLATGGYLQLSHANTLIDGKKDSYLPVELSGIWIKENSKIGDKVMAQSLPQTFYYSEREEVGYLYNSTNTLDIVKDIENKKPRYLVFGLFENGPQAVIQQGQNQGYYIISMPFVNSTIVTQNNMVVQQDLKEEVDYGVIKLKKVYPEANQIKGMWIYEVQYTSPSSSV